MNFIFTNVSQHAHFFYILFLLFSISIYLRFLLQFFGQTWITTTSHTTTLVFLPFVTFIITKVIAGNIALSLGMVGALSIVRFRNPVRSPLELTIYFAAITMGISASVNILFLIFFTFGISFLLLSLYLINFVSEKFFKKSFFTTSFSEGNNLSTLDIHANGEIEILNKSKYLTLKNFQSDEVNYVLSFSDFVTLKEFEDDIKNNKKIISYQINR